MRSRVVLAGLALAVFAGLGAAQRPKPPGILPGEEAPNLILTLDQFERRIDWGVDRILAPKVWPVSKGKGVKVAVLDTGVDLNHPDLKGAIVAARDFTGSPSGPSDVNGHGTWCAGCIAARGREDGRGMLGVAPEVTLIIGKVLGDDGSGSDQGIANGIDWATAQGADVISMSLGSDAPSPTIQAACKRAVAAGVIVVAAAGNSGPGEGTVGFPGGFPECVCVAATDSNNRVASFSSRGAAVFIAAPGVRVTSLAPGGRYASMDGTSMATPHVAGAAALFCDLAKTGRKADSPKRFKDALVKCAQDLGPVGRDTAYGYGLLLATKMVDVPVTPPVDPPAPPAPPAPTPGTRIVLRPGDKVPDGVTITIEIAPVPVPKEMPAKEEPKPAAAPKTAVKAEPKVEVAPAPRPVPVITITRYTADWCGPCRRMDEVLNGPLVTGLVWGKLGWKRHDLSQDKTFSTVQGKGITTIPLLIATDESGKELGRLSGYQPAEVVAGWLASLK